MRDQPAPPPSDREGELLTESDVSDWSEAGEEELGTKPKQWLSEPGTEQRWLWKPTTQNQPAGQEPYLKGDDWAEVVSSHLGLAMGVPTATVHLARRRGQVGTISLNFTGGAVELVAGNVILAGKHPDYPSSGSRFDPHYTLDAVLAALATVGAPLEDPELAGAKEWFAGYLALDALVGNTDRHHENWGILAGDGNTLAPSYDHASSLGFLLSDGDRVRYLEGHGGGLTVEGWADRAKTPFAGRPHPCEVAVSAFHTMAVNVERAWLGRLRGAISEIDDLLRHVPPARMGDQAKEFANRLVKHNGARLLSHPCSRIGS